MSPWHDWQYTDWNEHLIEHVLGSRGRRGWIVERVNASPQELADIVGAPHDNAEQIVHAFVGCIRHVLRRGVSLEKFGRQGLWKHTDGAPPHFFGVLWFTCLVAYGYPDDHGGFHQRLGRVLNKHVHVDELPALWKELERWTGQRAAEPCPRYCRLILPPPCPYRTNIGASWFLAFPHRSDRETLRRLLSRADLFGEEPPLDEVTSLLVREKDAFSVHFRDDLEQFVGNFIEAEGDIENSPFWSAIKREHFAHDDMSVAVSFPTLAIHGSERPVPYVACSPDTPVPDGFRVLDLPGATDELCGVILADPGDDFSEGVSGALRALIEGRLSGSRSLIRQIRRGVVVFREGNTPQEFRLVSGTDADGADRALVADAHDAAFRRAYGGWSEPSVPGWQVVVGCDVDVGDRLPQGLEHIRHLKRTELLPRPRLVGGIRVQGGYLALRKHLPRIRHASAEEVSIRFGGEVVARCTRRTPEGDFELPDHLASGRLGKFDVATAPRVAHLGFELKKQVPGIAYKGPPKGSFFVETSTGGKSSRAASDLTLDIETTTFANKALCLVPRAKRNASVISDPALLKEALAAIANNRSEIGYGELLRFFELGFPDRKGKALRALRFDLMRACTEMGMVDFVRRKHWRGTIVVPRRPRLVAYRRGHIFEAALIGLSPGRFEEQFMKEAGGLGIDAWRGRPTTSVLAPPLRVEASDPRVLDRLALRLSLAPTEWVLPPSRVRLEASLREDEPPVHHMGHGFFDPGTGRFDRGVRPQLPFAVERRTHTSDHDVYVLYSGGEVWGWSYDRHVPLLVASEALHGEVPFALGPDGELERTAEGVYLPLALGRLCTVLGTAPPGPRPTLLGWEYTYPFGRENSGWLAKTLPFGRTVTVSRSS